MISLKDEIKRFENMVYNKQLSQFVTVDQMFVGGGITIESMIHESNFIVEELKKMNAVFVNYCKLNEKVYNKMVEHELNLLNDQDRINGLAGSMDRKVTEMIKSFKELHESTVNQNVKSIKMFDSITQPLKKQLEKKVDKITFESKMKKFLQEYDEGGFDKDNQSIEGGEEPNQVTLTNEKPNQNVIGVNYANLQTGITQQGLPIVKKKGKVGYEDFYKLQAQLYARMKQSDVKLEQALTSAVEGKQLMLKYLPIINKNATDASTNSSEIYKLTNDITAHRNQLESSINKVYLDLSHRTNDQIWNNKLDYFYDKSIKPVLHDIQESIKVNSMDLKMQKQEIQKRNAAVNDEIKKIKSNIQDMETNLKKNSKDILMSSELIKMNHEQFLRQKHNNDKNIDNIKKETSSKFKDLQKQFKTEVEELKHTLQNLIHTIGETVLKTVNKKVESQLKLIEQEIRANRDKIKVLKNEVDEVAEEIKNMKEILSRKANFSDIIHQVQKKADKEDFKDFQIRLHESSQQFVSKNLNESINQSKLEKMHERNRGSSLTRANKTLFAPRSTPNRLNKTDFDVSTKLFMCGLEGHIEVKSNISHNQNSRRRSIKSSAAVISDLAV